MCGEQCFDGRGKRCRTGLGRVAACNVSAAIDQKLCEIPLNALDAEDSGLACFQKAVKRVGRRTIDVDAGEEGKGDVVISTAEVGNLVGGSRLLAAGLVSGKSKHGQPAVFVGPMKALKRGILRGETTLAGSIDDEQDAAHESLQRNRAPIEEERRKCIDASGWCRHSGKTPRSEDVMSEVDASKGGRGTRRLRDEQSGSAGRHCPARLR